MTTGLVNSTGLRAPILKTEGGTGVTSVTTAPTASAFAGWDSNSNMSANNFLASYATTATAAGTTTLTVASAEQQYFTGSTTQTVVLPVTSTLVLGQQFAIVNNSTGTVTVESSGGNTIQAMAQNTTLIVTCILTSGTTAGSWNAQYVSSGGSGTVTAVATGGPLSGGPITTSGTVTVASNAITYGYLQQETASTLLGNPSGSLGNVEEITLGSNLSFSGTVLNSTNTGGTVTSIATGGPLSGGPITGSGTVTIASNAITYGYLQQETAETLLGNSNSGTSNVQEITLGSPLTFQSTVLTIADHGVTYAKIQQASADTLIGNPAGSLANVEEITLGNGLGFTGTTLQLNPAINNYTTVSLTASQFKNLSGTPVLAIAAPGAGYTTYINNWWIEVIFGTTQYTSGSNWGLYYGSPATNTAAGVATSTITNAVAASGAIWPPALSGTTGVERSATACVNTAINIGVTTSNFATGDSTFVLHIWYSTLPVTI